MVGYWYNMMVPDDLEMAFDKNNAFQHNNSIVARHEWGAKKPRSRLEVPGPLSGFRFRFTETDVCRNFSECSETVRRLQLKHLRAGYPDIQYSFLIGGDGCFYEGVGWSFKVKDIQQELPDEDDTPNVILAYICHQQEFNENAKLRKYMEQQGQRLLTWAVENKKMKAYYGPDSTRA